LATFLTADQVNRRCLLPVTQPTAGPVSNAFRKPGIGTFEPGTMLKGSAVPSDRSDAGIRLLGYAAARRRNLQVDEALRPRRVGPRPDGLLPRTLPAVVNSRRVLPVQRGGQEPGLDYPDLQYWSADDDDREPDTIPTEHRPLVDELSAEEMAREAMASLRQHRSPNPEDGLTPELLELGDRLPHRADRRVPSGRHRTQMKTPEPSVDTGGRQRIRLVWAVAAAGVLALGTGFTAWAMTTPSDTDQRQLPSPSQQITPAAPAVIDPVVIGTTQPATPTPVPATEVVPSVTSQPQPVATAGPAVVITLDSDDPGFGWPSSAFATGNP
jgi:hypothetical protein